MPEAIFANHVRVLKITYVLDKVLRQLFLNSICLLTFNGLRKFVKMKIPDFEQWNFTVELVVNAQIQSGSIRPPKYTVMCGQLLIWIC